MTSKPASGTVGSSWSRSKFVIQLLALCNRQLSLVSIWVSFFSCTVLVCLPLNIKLVAISIKKTQVSVHIWINIPHKLQSSFLQLQSSFLQLPRDVEKNIKVMLLRQWHTSRDNFHQAFSTLFVLHTTLALGYMLVLEIYLHSIFLSIKCTS